MVYEISKIIHAERTKRGWDQAELVRRLGSGVRQQAVSGWERGTSRPKREMIGRLASAFGMDSKGLHSLLAAAGYTTAITDSKATAKRPVRPNVDALPLSELAFDRFEQFCADLAHQLHPDLKVHRQGSSGHKQYGADVIASDGEGIRIAYQCKRKRQFGSADVKSAIQAATMPANEYIIMLSRIASPGARTEVRKHVGWDIWDVDDISRVTRNLPLDTAIRLVETYFPGWREAFLGIPEAGPWQTTEEFFRRFSGDQIFSHTWPFVGRKELLKEISTFLARDDQIGILSGNGGSGKTRLLRAAAESAEHDGFSVRFLEIGKDLKPDLFEQLPAGKLLIILDDAHERSDVAEVISGVTRVNANAKLIISIRPYGFSQLAYDLRRVALHPAELSKWTLEDLKIEEAEQLGREILGKDGNQAVIQRLAIHTHDCPLVTVVGAGLIRRGVLDPSKLEGDESIKEEIFSAFRNALVVDPTKGEPRVFNALLNAIAIMQPVPMKDGAFTEALSKLTDRALDEIMPYIKNLEDAGVLIRRGHALRIVPDLLGDVILAEACADRSGASTGYIERVHRELSGLPLQHVVVNATRVDWQVAQDKTGSQSLVASLWKAIEEEFKAGGIRARQQILKLLQKVAFFQPERTLTLTRWAINNPTDALEETDNLLGKIYAPSYQDVMHEIPNLLKHIAYNFDYLPAAADLLWELSKTDRRPTNQYPNHPIRALCDLSAYQIGKPLIFNEAMIDAVERWLETDDIPSLPYSPFDVVTGIMVTEGSDDFSEGISITFRPYPINQRAVKDLRDRVNALALKEATSQDVKRASEGIKLIEAGLKYPAGLFGREISDHERDIWTPVFVETINGLAVIAKSNTLDPVLNIAIRQALQWHRYFSKSETRAAATTIYALLPTTVEHQLSLALHDGWGRLMFDHMQDYHAAEERRQKWYESVADELIKDRDGNSIIDLVQERLVTHYRAFSDYGTPGPFIWTLIKKKPEIGSLICERIVAKPGGPLGSILPIVLGVLCESEPNRAVDVARGLLSKKDKTVTRAVAQAFGWNRGLRPVIKGEIELLRELATEDDPAVRNSVIRAAQLIARDKHPDVAADLLSRVTFTDDTEVAKEMLSTFASYGFLKWTDMTPEQADRIWGQLLHCPSLGDYEIDDFLSEVSSIKPDEVLKLLKERVEYSERHPNTKDFRPVPYIWHHQLHMRDSARFTQLLREVRDWIASKPDSWQRQELGPQIFSAVAGGFDDIVLTVLDEVLLSGSDNQLNAVGAILRKAPRNLIWDRSDFVQRLLRAAAERSEDSVKAMSSDLFAAAISGSRSGTPGQPFPEDVEQLTRSAELANTFAYGSVEANFYKALEQSAKERINWHAERDEQLIDGREWD